MNGISIHEKKEKENIKHRIDIFSTYSENLDRFN